MKVLLALLFTLSNFSFAATEANKASQLDDLIRGEMAAVRTYNDVLEKVKDKKEVQKLTSMKKDHENAIATLKRYASSDVKEDTKDSGVWGSFTNAFTSSAKLFGNEAAIKALKQGEEHGVSEYKEALEDKNVSEDVKKIIKAQLLPKQESHLKEINTMM